VFRVKSRITPRATLTPFSRLALVLQPCPLLLTASIRARPLSGSHRRLRCRLLHGVFPAVAEPESDTGRVLRLPVRPLLEVLRLSHAASLLTPITHSRKALSMSEPTQIDKKTARHIRALVITQDDALKGRPWRSLKEIKRALKAGEIT
jgi:hypothetical protein